MHIIATSHTSRNFLLPELSSVTVDVLSIYIAFRLPPPEAKSNFNMRHHLPASTGETL